MNGGIIQRVLGTGDTHKAGSLFKGLGAKALHVLQSFAASIGTILFAVLHNSFRKGAAEACHMGKERSRGAVHVHAHHVHATFHHFVQTLLQFALVHVVLVLAHPDRLGLHLHEFCQGVLQATTDRNCSTGGHVFLREFLDGDHAGAVHGSTGFAHDDAGRNLALELQGHLATECVGLAACRAVADGDQVNLVLVNELHQVHAGTGLVILGLVGVNHAMVQELAILIQNGHLAARTETRVQGQHSLVASRSGQQYIL